MLHNYIFLLFFLDIRKKVLSLHSLSKPKGQKLRKFTAVQLRIVMENVQGVTLDIKNFHKKLAAMPCVVPLEERGNGVNHRAARYPKYRNSVKP